jgi:mono/diheme cytochrome c family protein
MHRSVALIAIVAFPCLSACGRQAAAASATPDVVKRGAYLAAFGGCNDCHTPKMLTPQGPVPDTTRALSGYPADAKVPPVPPSLLSPTGWAAASTADLTAWAGPWGVAFAANLTPDSTGLARWTEETFIATMRTGRHLGVGRPILPPMPWEGLGGLTDDDLKALFAYLKTVKPVHNVVPLPLPPADAH